MATQIAIAVVEHNGRFLIGQRPAGRPLAGYWEFPGGKIEQGETAEEAAVRECLEEAGLAIEAVGRYPSRLEQYGHGAVELHFVACRAVSTEKPSHPRFRWVDRLQLDQYEFPAGNRQLLNQLLAPQERVESNGP